MMFNNFSTYFYENNASFSYFLQESRKGKIKLRIFDGPSIDRYYIIPPNETGEKANGNRQQEVEKVKLIKLRDETYDTCINYPYDRGTPNGRGR